MLESIGTKPFLVAIIAGACAQFVKVLSFLIIEKKVNYRRFVQTDGAPNMHSTAFAALSVAVGFQEGFQSLSFGFAVCLTSIILVDTLNVKTAASRQAEAVLVLLERVGKPPPPLVRKGLSYTPMDVFSGTAMGIFLAFLMH